MGIFSSRSDMKRMSKKEGFNVFAVGEKLYLFVPETGTDRVVISAHGGRSKNTNSFKVPTDTVLRFYSNDKNTVLDPGFANFYHGEAAPKEILSEGDVCFDYTLSKYQGASNNKANETYDSIAKAIASAAKSKTAALKSAEKASGANREKLLNIANRNKMAAVLTVRNRFMAADVSLAYAIDQVKAVTPHILIFDCLFCRWLDGGTDEAVPITARA